LDLLSVIRCNIQKSHQDVVILALKGEQFVLFYALS